MGLEILLAKTDPEPICFESDLYWIFKIVKAGYNPIKLFQQHPYRFKMWRVKEMDKKEM